MSENQEPIASIISLGRRIGYGAKMQWKKEGAFLTMPNGKTVKLPMRNNCPHASGEILKEFESLKDLEQRKRRGKQKTARLVRAYKAKITSQKQLDEHRRGGHAQYSAECPECK